MPGILLPDVTVVVPLVKVFEKLALISEADSVARRLGVNCVLPPSSIPVRRVPGAFLKVELPPMLLATTISSVEST